MPRYASALELMQVPVRQLVPEKSATAPASPVAGQMWVDTSVTPAKLRWHDGTQWINADGTSIPAGYITDALISNAAGISLAKLATDPLARSNHTGTQPAATISDFDARVRTSRLDQLTAPNGQVDLNGQRLVNLGNPTLGTDAVNKSYVDNARAGISVKDPVRVAATGNVALSSPGAAIDGVTLEVGDRFLAPIQNTATQNGIYVFNGPTTAATRSEDANSAGEVFDGSMIAVAEGTHAGYQFIQTATASGAPGSWTQSWIVFQTGGQTYLAGNGLKISGTTFAIDGPVSIANGGTGASTAAGARAGIAALTRYAETLPALSAGVAYTVTHGLGTQDVVPVFRTMADNRRIDLDWVAASATTLTVTSDIAFAAGAIRAVIAG